MDILHVLENHAGTQPGKMAFGYIGTDSGLCGQVTYQALLDKVRGAASDLHKAYPPGSRILILLPAGAPFIISFLAALHAGLIPVPCPVGYSEAGAERILKIIADCEAAGIITDLKTHKMQFQRKTDASGKLQRLPLGWVFTEQMIRDQDTAAGLEGIRLPGRPAYLQYTSGSTSAPKGVMISHENLMANLQAINNWFGRTRDDISVTWLPHYHDMGLVDGLLSPLFTGGTGLVMSPMLFVTNPFRYLQTISDYGAAFSGGPGFGLDHCVSRITDAQLSGLDLRALRVLYVGAELLRAPGLRAFIKRMKNTGFDPRCLVPAYGMAEATLAISLDYPEKPVGYRPEETVPPREVVACGPPVEKTEVAIVDPDTLSLVEGGLNGEIWVKGPGVAAGYWRNPAATRETFGAYTACGRGPYLRTGDLGFMVEGQVHITGRRKELIIIRGVNYYPQDIEEVVSRSHEDIPLNATAAFSVETAGGEALMIVSELKRKVQNGEETERIRIKIAREVGLSFGLIPHEIRFIQAGKLPKTSSGKIQRLAARQLFA